MTVRHAINLATAATRLHAHTAKCTFSGLPQEKRMSWMHSIYRLGASCLLILAVILTLSVSTNNTLAVETSHDADGHHEKGDSHGEHHSEIAANPPPGTSLEDFESPQN